MFREEDKSQEEVTRSCSLTLSHSLPGSVWVCSPAMHIQFKVGLSISDTLSHFILFISLDFTRIALYCVIVHSDIIFSKIKLSSLDCCHCYVLGASSHLPTLPLFPFHFRARGPTSLLPPVTSTDWSR